MLEKVHYLIPHMSRAGQETPKPALSITGEEDCSQCAFGVAQFDVGYERDRIRMVDFLI